MNYQNFAEYSNKPPSFTKQNGKTKKKINFVYDQGNGIPVIPKRASMNEITKTPFLFLQEHNNNYANASETALKGIQTRTELSDLFFSKENFKRIQNKIKIEIYKRTKGEFKLEVDQEESDLLVAMRSVFLEHARFLPNFIVRQVKRLNEQVIDNVVPEMLTSIKQNYFYLKEINKPIEPIARPQNINNKGRKMLPSTCTIFQ